MYIIMITIISLKTIKALILPVIKMRGSYLINIILWEKITKNTTLLQKRCLNLYLLKVYVFIGVVRIFQRFLIPCLMFCLIYPISKNRLTLLKMQSRITYGNR